MPRFLYQALNESQKLVAGDVQAESALDAIAELQSQGLTVQSIRIETLELTPGVESQRPKPGRPTAALPADYDAIAAESVLQKQLATLLERGRTLTPALRAYVAELPEGSERRELSAVCTSLDSGDAAAASKAMAALPEYWIPLLSAAAASGDAGRVIRDFLKESREATEFRWQRWRALAYPIIVAIIALAVAVALSLTVLPVYGELFASFGLQQPELTQFIFAAGNWLASDWGAATIGGAVLLAALAALGVLPGVEWLRASRWGSWFGRSTAVAQFTRFTSELLSAGVSRGDAVRIAAHTTRHPAMQRAGWNLAAAIEEDVDDLPAAPRPVPATAVYALHGDLPTEARERLLAEISGCYSDRASRRLSWTRGLIGPAAILVIGICVGVVVMALFLPLVTLVNNLSG